MHIQQLNRRIWGRLGFERVAVSGVGVQSMRICQRAPPLIMLTTSEYDIRIATELIISGKYVKKPQKMGWEIYVLLTCWRMKETSFDFIFLF